MTLAKLFTHVFVTKEYNLVSGLRAVMPCGWEGNRVPGREQWQPTDGFIKSSLYHLETCKLLAAVAMRILIM